MANVTTPYFTGGDMVILAKNFKKIGRNLRKKNVDVKRIPGWNRRGDGVGPWMAIVKRGWRQG